MCSNWKRGNRKEDMTLAEIDRVMDDPFWHAVENLNISGGEPTTRNDLPELVELFVKRLPRLRKLGINTTGLTPHRAIPMLTRIVKFCSERDVPISILAWARERKLDVVFNMLRFTDNMLGNRSLEESIGFRPREEEYMRTFFLDRVKEESILSGQAFMYLHYADMIANGYQRTM